MAEKTTYYAIVSDRATREHPSGLARRYEDERGSTDKALGRDMEWHWTSLIHQWDRADSMDELYEVGEDEANRIIEELRDRWSQLP